MIAGSSTPPIYYAFYCDDYTTQRNTYLGFIWLTNILALLYILHPIKFEKRSTRMAVQIAMFFAGGSSVAIPLTKMLWYRDPAHMSEF